MIVDLQFVHLSLIAILIIFRGNKVTQRCIKRSIKRNYIIKYVQ